MRSVRADERTRGRTVIFDIIEYIIMEWTMPNESRICKICRRQSSIGQNVLLLDLKIKQGRSRVRKVLGGIHY